MVEPIIATGIEEVIRHRRTIKPERFNGKIISDDEINTLLELADCAPTHAKTEPWRFVVFGPEKVAAFGADHARLYQEFTPAQSFTPQKSDNIRRQAELSSHVILVWMRRVPSHKIPEMEEIAAVSAAIQNILLGAAAKGIASFWSTGGMALHPGFHSHFQLGPEDKVIGILYLGYSDDPAQEATRLTPLAEKIQWVR